MEIDLILLLKKALSCFCVDFSLALSIIFNDLLLSEVFLVFYV